MDDVRAEAPDDARQPRQRARVEPAQGDPVDLVHIDEDLFNEAWVGEMQARLSDTKGRMVWSAFPHSKNDALVSMSERAQQEHGDRDPDIAEFVLTFSGNQHIDQGEKAKRLKAWGPEERRALDAILAARFRPILDQARLIELRRACDGIYLDGKLRGYLLDLVTATRQPAASGMKELAPLIAFGASPRATLFLARAAKAMALLSGRGYVIPEDVKEIAPDVLRHRVVPTYEAEAQNLTSDDLVARLLDRVEVP